MPQNRQGISATPPAHNTDAAIRMALGSLLDRTRRRLSRRTRLRAAAGKALRAASLSVSWEEVSLSVSFGSESEEDLAEELFATVELALAKGRDGIILLLDEAQLVRDGRDRHGEHPFLPARGALTPPLRSADLSATSEKTPGNINVLLGRLVDAGALYRIRKGEYAYTAPKFRDYLRRRESHGVRARPLGP
jgi:hypothetical protein